MTQMGADKGDEQTYAIIGAAQEVHRQLGHGFLEAVYQEALRIEFEARRISYEREVSLGVVYKGVKLACGYRADFVCFGSVIVELKAQSVVGGVEESQVLNYLKATGFERGLLLNFGVPRLDVRRLILSKNYPHPSAQSATSADKEVDR